VPSQIQQDWEKLALANCPDLNEDTMKVLRRVFFAGAYSVVDRAINIGSDDVVQVFGDYVAESTSFALDVLKGKA
jgi:hypothetical protein